jgi:2'-5' RNA ligase
VRLFLAADLPPGTRDALAAARDDLRERLAGWRWLEPSGVHLTLRFLGEVEADSPAAGVGAWRDAVATCACPTIRFGGAGAFPPRGPARVLWVGACEAPGEHRLLEIAERLERRARELGFPPELRAFHPHLTLARATSPRAARPAADAVGDLGAITVRAVVLFRSRLERRGATYERIGALDLATADRNA